MPRKKSKVNSKSRSISSKQSKGSDVVSESESSITASIFEPEQSITFADSEPSSSDASADFLCANYNSDPGSDHNDSDAKSNPDPLDKSDDEHSDDMSLSDAENSLSRLLLETILEVPSETPSKAASKAPSKTPSKTATKVPSKTPSKATSKTAPKAPAKTTSKTASKAPAKTPSKAASKSLPKAATKPPSKTPSVPMAQFKETTQTLKSKPKIDRKQKNPIKRQDRVIEDIIRLQKSCDSMIAKAPFQRLVQEIMRNTSNESPRITREALMALQTSAEKYLTNLMEDSYLLSLHRGRVTLTPRDIQIVLYIRNARSGHKM